MWWNTLSRGVLGLLLAVAFVLAGQARGSIFNTGDVFVGLYNGQVEHFSPSGALLDTFDTGLTFKYSAGMCFDSAGNLRTTDWGANTVSEFDNGGHLLRAAWASGFRYHPESCTVDSSGKVYVGEATGDKYLSKFDGAGNLLQTYRPAAQNSGINRIDLAPDQCTMYYTSEGNQLKRYNVCTQTQLSDFATLPSAACFDMRVRSNGEVIVTCNDAVYRLGAAGTIVQTYSASTYGDSRLEALALDPDSTSFWTTDIYTGHITKIAIADGRDELDFDSGSATGGVYGIGVYGEPAASVSTRTGDL